MQIETEKDSGRTSKWKVEWINDCEYKLVLVDHDYHGIENLEKGMSNTFEIIKSDKNYYIFKLKFSIFNKGYIDTLWKLN